MKREWIASTIFNLVFFAVTAVMCALLLPLLLLPRKLYISAVKFWINIVTFLEKHILGLTYEIRGAKNIPKEAPYLIAAKHQSAYETFKLHVLFDNPAIILKKELLSIPLWGWYLKKSDVIAIDRSTPDKAIKSIEDGALRVCTQGRPIVIFPQGTRVRPEFSPKDKPYKPGIARIQAATNLPIIPMALNSGLFWPRKGWLKSSGTVIFEFLEPIEPGLDKKVLMKTLESKIENASGLLMNEAQINAVEKQKKKRSFFGFVVAALVLFVAYSSIWFKTAEVVKDVYIQNVQKFANIERTGRPVISGYPGKIKLDVLQQTFINNEGSMKIQVIHAESWPWIFSPVTIIKSLANDAKLRERNSEATLEVKEIKNESWSSLLTPIEITTGPVIINHFKWKNPVKIDSSKAVLTYKNHVLHIHESSIKQDTFEASGTARIDLKQKPVTLLENLVEFKNHETLLMNLAENEILKPKAALFMGAGLNAIRGEDDTVKVELTQRGRILYAGPLPVGYLPE